MSRTDHAQGVSSAGQGWGGGWRRYRVALLALLLGCGLSLAGWRWFRAVEQADFATRFALDAEGYAGAMRQHLGEHEAILRSIADLHAITASPTPADFRAFTSAQRAAHPGLLSLAWLPRVTAAQRAAFEATAAADFRGFRISELGAAGIPVPAGARREYFPLRLIEPASGNEAWLGLDSGTQARIAAALALARDTAALGTAAGLTLLPASEASRYYLLSLPVYRKNASVASLAERREALEGYVVGVFLTAELVDEAIRHMSGRGLDIWVLDGAPETGKPLHFHRSRTRSQDQRPPTLAQALAGFHHRVAMHPSNAHWWLLFAPAPAYPAQPGGYTVLVTGLLLSLGLAAYLGVSADQRARLRLLAQALEREKGEAQEINRVLRESQHRLQEQLDELRRFENLTIGRELRVKELADENRSLRQKLSASAPAPPP